MNKDQLKGTAKDTTGAVQEKLGEATGNKDQQAKGEARQVEGKVQKGLGNVKEGVKDALKKP
ncbi:MAG: CsbD family protein [Ramlibacter sp.]|nr:CsbD family protein [Ramlibacter sp.]